MTLLLEGVEVEDDFHILKTGAAPAEENKGAVEYMKHKDLSACMS